jgi:hypothetical protein
MLDLLSKSKELRQLAYTLFTMLWIVMVIKTVRWW